MNFIDGEKLNEYKIINKIGEGADGITYKAKDEIGGYVVLKIIKTPDSRWMEEAEKAVRLRNIPQIAMVFNVGETIRKTADGTEQKLKYIVWEYIEGITLQSILESNKPIPSTLIIDLVRELGHAIKKMNDIGLVHGDLHSNNIILIPPDKDDLEERYRLKVVDFGLARSIRATKYKEDMEYLAEHLKACWDCNQNYGDRLTPHDKIFQKNLINLIRRMNDENLERRVYDPAAILSSIQKMKDYSMNKNENNVGLEHPFEYLNAEEIPEKTDLITRLYINNVPWLQEIEDSGTTVISGPRGSGKSMILKNMQLQTKMNSINFTIDSLKAAKYLGFYVHSQNMLYMPFVGVGIEYNKKTLDKFIHYLNLLFSSQILDALIILNSKNILKFDTILQNILFEFFQKHIFKNNIKKIYINSDNLFQYSKTLIEKEIFIIQKQIQNNESMSSQSTASYLHHMISTLDSLSPIFKTKKFYFLLDDYSLPKINMMVQKSLNRIIGFRNDRFYFKITTEKFGFILQDLDDKILQQDREFSYVDLGVRFMKAEKMHKKQFIKDIFDKRLKRTGIKLFADEFFGPQQFDKIADELISIQKRNDPDRKPRFEYAGFDVIYKLCMGDISTILQLCKEIYYAAKNNDPNLNLKGIKPKIQDEVIRKFSQKRLSQIKNIPRFGQELYNITESFGAISKKYLYDYNGSDKSKFLEVLRIELTDSDACMNEYSYEMYKQLIFNGIFLDAGSTYPWERIKASNTKLILRPIYTPALKISYNDRYPLKIDCKTFEKFLTEPKKFEKYGNRTLKQLADEQSTIKLNEFIGKKTGDIKNEQ